MNKRKSIANTKLEQPRKIAKVHNEDFLAKLSDEALLVIFSYLASKELALCASVCKRWNTLANDSLVWKHLFFTRFIEPRLPSSVRLRYRMEDQWLQRTRQHEPDHEWKSLYRLRDNWHRGRCSIDKIDMSNISSHRESNRIDAKFDENVVVQLHGRLVFTANSELGLAVWNYRGQMLTSVDLYNTGSPNDRDRGIASSLSVHNHESFGIILSVGFTLGGFAIYSFQNSTDPCLECLYSSFPEAPQSSIAIISFEYPFVVTLSVDTKVAVYRFQKQSDILEDAFREAVSVCSLQSQAMQGPTSLAMRRVPASNHVVCTIAYSHCSLASGWTVAIQEIILDCDVGMVGLRSASSSAADSVPGLGGQYASDSLQSPTSLSYAHPFLITSHADNTLVSYLVKSTSSEFTIGQGVRLWGHTSAVANVEVKHRGKAVSISSNGNEIRVWNLEPYSMGKHDDVESVKLEIKDSDAVPWDSATTIKQNEFFGFDEEKVVVGQVNGKRKVLMVYDFT